MLNDHEPSKRGYDDSYLINRTRVSVNPSGNTNFASKSRSRKSDEPNYAQLKKDAPGLIAAAAHAAVPSWTSMVLMVSLIFGGCCANVGV
jgi:UDP-xylose/UDP-N-acetylglucosamine transporter B4